MNSPSAPAMKLTSPAMSEGRPTRPTGVRDSRLVRIAPPGSPASPRASGVSITPGPIALTVMPCGPRSCAQPRTMMRTPAFVAEFDHLLRHRLHGQEHTGQIDVDLVLPILQVHLEHRAAAADAGIGERDVEPAEPLDAQRCGRLHLRLRRDVRLRHDRP